VTGGCTDTLEISGVRCGYGRDDVVRGVTLSVGPSDAVCIVGPNGAGKTTLLSSLFGLAPLHGGEFRWNCAPVRRPSAGALARVGVLYVVEGNRVFSSMTVADNLAVGAYAAGRRPSKDRVRFVYDLFPVLEVRARQAAGTLSGGEKKMLAVGRALMAEPKLLVLDEPTAGLAPKVIAVIGDALSRLRAEGMGLLVAEQGLMLPDQLRCHTYLMERGVLTWSGESGDLASVPQLATAVVGKGLATES
jgi:branched-chain amino acid transport system ATP-binding protein